MELASPPVVRGGVRWMLFALLAGIGCGGGAATRPAAVDLDAGAPLPDGPLGPCPRPTGESSLEIEPPTLVTSGDDSPAPLTIAVRNPNAWPVFVTEAHMLKSDRWPTVQLSFDPLLVPPRSRVVLPRKAPVRPSQTYFVRILYIDGWGNERSAVQPIERAGTLAPPTRRAAVTAAAELWCKMPEPPSLLPLVLSTDPAAPEIGPESEIETPVWVHNPNAARVRIVHAGVEHPDGGSTWPATEAKGLEYLNGGDRTRLHYRITVEAPGRHELEVKYIDGWARLHSVRAPIEVKPAARESSK